MLVRIGRVAGLLIVVMLVGACGGEDDPQASCTHGPRTADPLPLTAEDAIGLAESDGATAVAFGAVDGEVPGHRSGDQWEVVAVELDDGSTPVFGIAIEPVFFESGQAFGRSALNQDAADQGWGSQPAVTAELGDLVPAALDCLSTD